MPAAALLPPVLRDRPFTVHEAVALGVSRERLRGRDLRAPHRGVRVPAHLPDDLETRCRAAALALPETAVFSGRTAAVLCRLPWRLGAPDVLGEPLQVVVPPPSRAPRIAGIAVAQSRWAGDRHRLADSGLVVLHPRQQWCEVVAEMPFVDAVALADGVRRRWASEAQMAEAVSVRAGDRSAVRQRQVLELVRYPVDSGMETHVRLLLVGAGLPEPVCGRDVVVDGGWVARPDLSWPRVRVAVEYDGGHHRTDARQWAKDVRRRQLLELHGWRVVVLTAADVLRWPEQTVALVAGVLRERGLRW